MAAAPEPAAARELTLAEQSRMVDALQASLQAGAAPVQRIETHVSFVLVAPDFAYKIKKAVAPGFLDFSRLALRRHFCAEELRLNRRFAPSLYRDVVPITGTPEAPVLGGDGPPIDHAVRMRAFAQDGLWDRLAARGELTAAHVDALAGILERFHREAAVAAPDSGYGGDTQLRGPVLDTLGALDALLIGPAEHERLQRLRAWESRSFAELQPVYAERRRAGRVRECHGDLHLGNVAQVEGRTTLFDALEFDPALRWTDVTSEIAFIAMDLQVHGLAGLAQRLVNAYLERSGDYGGMRVLRYGLVYRALVRAKVAALRAAAAAPYLDVARATTAPPPPVLLITHGPSGSGKTTLTQGLLEAAAAVRIRADVERKRLSGLAAQARSGSTLGGGIYAPQASVATYARLRELAVPVLAGGWHVILDATFLRRAQRDGARELAAALGLRFVILDFDADVATLRERIVRRAARGGDASEADPAVLEAQLRTAEPLDADEQPLVVRCVASTQGDDGSPQMEGSALLATLASR